MKKYTVQNIKLGKKKEICIGEGFFLKSKYFSMLKKICLLNVLFLISLNMDGMDLIKDSGMDNPDSGELHTLSNYKCAKLSRFTEEASWNRCAKLEVVRIYEDGGRKQLNGRMLIGGDAKNFGFSVAPGAVYDFSLRLRGKGKRVFIGGAGWLPDKKRWQVKILENVSKINPVVLTENWITVRGTFKVKPGVKRAALYVGFWGDERNDQLAEKVGDYVLVDDVSVKKRSTAPATEAAVKRENAVKRVVAVQLQQWEGAPNWDKVTGSGGFWVRNSNLKTVNDTQIKAVAGPKKTICTNYLF